MHKLACKTLYHKSIHNSHWLLFSISVGCSQLLAKLAPEITDSFPSNCAKFEFLHENAEFQLEAQGYPDIAKGYHRARSNSHIPD